MDTQSSGRFARCAEWLICRNPTYLVSAACMAAGARLLLVSPTGAAGDVRLILLTLIVLQVYEWAVSGVLLWLHRARRAPEDAPSLLLVALLFWTGPMAATVEMTVLDPELGAILAAGASLISVGELRLTCRTLGLRLSLVGQMAGSACLVLLAAAAPLLRIPTDADGTNELYLYGTWWVLGLLVLAGLPVARSYGRALRSAEPGAAELRLRQEFAFLALTFAATAVHLVGMNHAFFCHAAPFYPAPVIIAASIVGLELLRLSGARSGLVLAALAAMPAIAILSALEPFDAEFPAARLPLWLRDPLLLVLPAAASAWWFGFIRHRNILLLHAGNAALGLAAIRAADGIVLPGAIPGLPDAGTIPVRVLWSAVLFAAAVYLAITAGVRRCRTEGLMALAVNLAAATLLVWEKTPADQFVLCLVAGWSVLIGLHVVIPKPNLLLRLAPILFLTVTPWTCQSAASLRWEAGAHALALMVVLFVAGHAWRWTHYRWVTVLLAALHLGAFVEQWALQGGHPAAPLLVLGGFIWLAIGALVSWHKHRLVDSLRRRAVKEANAE